MWQLGYRSDPPRSEFDWLEISSKVSEGKGEIVLEIMIQ